MEGGERKSGCGASVSPRTRARRGEESARGATGVALPDGRRVARPSRTGGVVRRGGGAWALGGQGGADGDGWHRGGAAGTAGSRRKGGGRRSAVAAAGSARVARAYVRMAWPREKRPERGEMGPARGSAGRVARPGGGARQVARGDAGGKR